MKGSYQRLTLIAQRGKTELVVTIRRQGQQQTVMLNGQLVCSRTATSDELVLGPAAHAFDPSSLRDAIDQLATTIGHAVDTRDHPQDPGSDGQLELPVTALTSGPLAYRCERCASSTIYEGSEHPQVKLCPPCQQLESTQRARSTGLQLGAISRELTHQLCASKRRLTESARESFQEVIGRLDTISEKLCESSGA